MKKIKLAKEEDRDQKTLAKQYKRLEIFITIFMVIAICLGTFYFNVICFGTECENKSPTPLIIINTGKTNTNDKENQNALQENDNIQKRINEGYWYNDGIMFFFNNGVFSIGRYGTDGGHNGMIGEYKKLDNADTPDTYEFTAMHAACSDECMTPSNAYTLKVNLKYAVESTGEVVTINKMTKIEEGNTEELTNYEKTYQFAGTSWEEAEKYVSNLNN